MNMLNELLMVSAGVAGIATLWRTYRYDSDVGFNAYLDRLPYLLKKPVTCGLCFTFWVALLATALVDPFTSITLPYRSLPDGVTGVVTFVFSWMTIGLTSAFMVYVLDTFYQVSHFYKHAAHHHHDEPEPKKKSKV